MCWLRYDLLKQPQATVAPKWLQFIYYCLFPLEWFYLKQSRVRYDILTDVYTIHGMECTGNLLRDLSNKGYIGKSFRVTAIDDGIVTIEYATTHMDWNHSRGKGELPDITPHKRYLLFGHANYYPGGGTNDMIDSYDTTTELVDRLNKDRKEGNATDYYTAYDRVNGIVLEHIEKLLND